MAHGENACPYPRRTPKASGLVQNQDTNVEKREQLWFHGGMKAIYAREMTRGERAIIEGGLRSSSALTVRRCQILLMRGKPTVAAMGRHLETKSRPCLPYIGRSDRRLSGFACYRNHFDRLNDAVRWENFICEIKRPLGSSRG